MVREYPRPCIVIRRCSEFDPCFHDGSKIPSPYVAHVKSHADCTPVSPEVESGLKIPRDLLRSRVIRFREPGLLNQTFFAPYPAEPADLPEEIPDRGRDAGKGRDPPAVQKDIRQN